MSSFPNSGIRPLRQIKRQLLGQSLRSFNPLRVASAVKDGETVTIAGLVFQAILNSLVGLTAGAVAVDLRAAASTAAAAGVLTSSANYANGETVTIGTQVYTFKTALTGAANEVFIGASEAASITNLVAAINGSAGAGTLYGNGTVTNVNVTAVAASHTATLTAILKGTGPNTVATTETAANASFGAATLAGGSDASASDFTTAFTTAVNLPASGFTFAAERVSANEVLIESTADNSGAACAETLSGANNAFASATMYGGSAPMDDGRRSSLVSRSPNTAEIALLTMHFLFPFVPKGVMVQQTSSTGAIKAFDGKVNIAASSGRVTLTFSGAIAPVANDLVNVSASE